MSSGWLIFFALGGDILVLFAVVFALKVLWWLLWEVFPLLVWRWRWGRSLRRRRRGW